MTRRNQFGRLGCACPVPYSSTRALSGYRTLGRLGTSAGQAAEGIGVSVASKAAGGAATSAAVSSGLVAAGGLAAGALTLGVGLVVAFALGKLLTKNYLNVPQMNATEDQDVAAYNQYLTIMGQAPGRAFGLAPMMAVFRGANHSGLFPANNGVQCFHEGCSKYPGRGDWVNNIVNDYGVHGNISFQDAWYRFQQDRNAADFGPLAYNPHPSPSATAQSYTAASTPPVQPPGSGIFGAAATGPMTPQQISAALQSLPPMQASVPRAQYFPVTVATPVTPTAPMSAPAAVAAVAPRAALMSRGSLRGLGDTIASPGGQPDAVNFIDNFFLPYNIQHNTWVAPRTATEHQILYDVADAFLAGKGITTVPFVASPQPQVPPPTAPVAPVAVPPNIANTMMPNYSPTPVPPAQQPVYLPPVNGAPVQTPVYAVPPPETAIPNYGTITPTVDPTTGALVNPTLPAGALAGATVGSGGLTDIPTPLLLAGAAALVLGTVFLGKRGRRAKR